VPAADFSGAAALEATRRIVALGPRTPGSHAHRQMRQLISPELRKLRCAAEEVSFTAQTPGGPVAMANLLAKFKGSSQRIVVLSGHYDTKVFPGFRFIGANDGGASAGFLLEMARALSGRPLADNVWLVWFDGEEAFGHWTATDSLYGSRHMAQLWSRDGTITRIRALINVDMIGDRDLGIMRESMSTAWLRELIWRIARERGYGKYFLETGGATEDDHVPFLRLGVPAVDLIDFDYGPSNAWWHSPEDTMDKLSPRSFQVVGDVLLEVLSRLPAHSP
jgi:Zn-dependent M28 family amino/carboxypeptidase